MRIERNLNLVIPVEREGGTIYVHSTPLSRDVFERYYLVISKTFTRLYGEGLGFTAGPRVAALMLKEVAVSLGQWEGPEGVELGLVSEWRRLSTVITPEESKGWTSYPLQTAVDRKLLDGDELSEVENCLAFFIVASAMHKRKELPAILAAVGHLWGALVTLLNSTAYMSSLQTSTEDASSGETATASSIAS